MAYAQVVIEKHPRMEDNVEIAFKKEETKYLDFNHDDALIVFIWMINAQVKRVMIDACNFVDIPYFDTFQKLGLLTNNLTPITSSLIGHW